MYFHARILTELMIHRSGHMFPIYVRLKVALKCGSRKLGDFGPQVKNQMDKHNCMSLAPESVYIQGLYGNTTNSFMVDLFAELTHQCKSWIQGN